ncbi:MAG: thioredoxin family protein, partial [Alistipes sp.]|nr:thioredoxin family protein [Alistipes sp.]
EVPHLKAAYDKFHKKGFEIYGASFDRAREPWVKAIEEKKMNWIHVSAIKYWDNQGRHDYAVNSIPANFLIECATGKIIATQLRGEELEKKLEELLK